MVLIAALCAAQQATPTLTVAGPAKTLTITAQDWSAMPKTTVKATNAHDKTTSTYSGVLLRDLLHQAGVPTGEEMRGKQLAAYVRMTASDDYVVVFSIAELEPSIRDEDVLVADQVDGKPLPEKQGPLRLVVPGDKRPARWVRMLTKIEVINVK